MDPSQDPNVPSSMTADQIDDAAVQSALDQYNTAAAQEQNAAAKYDWAIAPSNKANASDIASASAQLDNARNQAGTAAKSYGDMLAKIAQQRNANARAAKDPNEQRLWANEADKAASQSELYATEADMYKAKTDAEIQAAGKRADAALSRAQSVAGRVQSQNDQSDASALLARTKAASIPALTNSTIALHQQQIETQASRAKLYSSQSGLADARAAFISGPQADTMVATGLLRQAEADWIKQKGGATLGELQARAGKEAAAGELSNARVNQIYANLGKSQVLPYADVNAPSLDVFQPLTGQVTGVQNPAYKNPYAQPLKDRASAIEAIKNDLAAGKFGTGQQAVDYANQLMDGISQAALFQAQGYTPQQYQQQVLQQGQFGKGLLDAYAGVLDKGQGAANTFLNYASKARGLGGMSFTPFSSYGQVANQLYGPSLQQAQALISQVQPVTDRMSALKAFSQLSQVRQHLSDAAGQGGTGPADQATNAGIDQANAAMSQAGGQTPPGGGSDMDNPMAQALFAGAFGR